MMPEVYRPSIQQPQAIPDNFEGLGGQINIEQIENSMRGIDIFGDADREGRQVEELDVDKDDNFPMMKNDFFPGKGEMIPPQIEQLDTRELPQPAPMSLQSSSESGMDSTIRDIKSDDFSISITQAKIITPEAKGGYFSYITPMT